MKKTLFGLWSLLFILIFSPGVLASENPITPDGPLQLTIYNQGVALIQQHLQGRIPQGESTCILEGVSYDIIPATIHVSVKEGPPDLSIQRQYFSYTPLTYGNMVEELVGGEVTFLFEDGARKTGLLLTARPDVLIQFDDHLAVNPPGRIFLERVPDGMPISPTICWQVQAKTAGDYTFLLHYLSQGLYWSADYVGVLDERSNLSLKGWITLQNLSQTHYRKSQVIVVAGEVQRVTPKKGPVIEGEMMLRSTSVLPEPEGVGEYYMYGLEGELDLEKGAFQQVKFLSAQTTVEQTFLFPRYLQEGSLLHTLTLHNVPEGGLGIPLPQGIVRIYQDEARGPLFLGEDRISHTGASQELELILGQAFDVTGHRRQIEWRQFTRESYLERQEITVKNSRKKEALVVVEAELGRGWKVSESSHEYLLYDANKILFSLSIPPGETEIITYTRVTE